MFLKEIRREEREDMYLDPVGKEKSIVVVLHRTRGILGPEVGVAGSTHYEVDLRYWNKGFLIPKVLYSVHLWSGKSD